MPQARGFLKKRILASKQSGKMRVIFNLILLVIAAVMAFLLYKSIQDPIAFNEVLYEREQAVIERLKQIRTTQELYRDITGEFAPSFDTLEQVLTNGRFTIINVQGDPDDPNFTGQITYDTVFRPAIDSIRSLGINLDSLPFVPYGNGARFDIEADTITYQATNVPVVEVGARYTVFMGQFGDPRYQRYNPRFDPNKPLKFGDMNRPNLAGNWE